MRPLCLPSKQNYKYCDRKSKAWRQIYEWELERPEHYSRDQVYADPFSTWIEADPLSHLHPWHGRDFDTIDLGRGFRVRSRIRHEPLVLVVGAQSRSNDAGFVAHGGHNDRSAHRKLKIVRELEEKDDR